MCFHVLSMHIFTWSTVTLYVQSIKYICNNVNKGSDEATFGLKIEQDEVKLYESGRYISSSEAVWRILAFPIHERFAVHLENGHRVYLNQMTSIT